MKKYICFCIFIAGIHATAQTGPGGVGNATNNALWLRADAGTNTTTNGQPIDTWNDMSGNNNHVTQTTAAQQPLYTSTLMNGYPAILFDFNNGAGQNDYLSGIDSPTLDNCDGLTIFTVIRPTNLGSARSIIAKRTNVGVNQAYMFFFFTSNYCYADIVSNDNRFSTNPTAYAANNNYIFDLHYDGSLSPASTRAKIYLGQTLVVTATETATTIPDYNSPLLVGTTHIGDNRAFGGYMCEIIIYREALGVAEKILVDNYLSAKYDIALTSNDVYQMDNPGSGNYDHEVAGIGRESASDLNDIGRGTGIVTFSNANGLNNNEYLMWGHDNGVLQAIESIDVPAGIEARFDRVWRASEVNKSGVAVDVGAVDITWDLTGLGAVTPSDLRLLVDTDNDGMFADETPISGAVDVGGNEYVFSGVTAITNQLRFTLATINLNQTPLPVELISFEATAIKNQTQLNWQTASEINSDKFEIERSTNGNSWSKIGEVKAATNSSHLLNYEFYDLQPNVSNYYRLKQIDLDGTFVYSSMRFVKFHQVSLQVYPNPVTNLLNVEVPSVGVHYLVLRNSLGQIIFNFSDQLNEDEMLKFDFTEYASGIYYLESNLGTVKVVK